MYVYIDSECALTLKRMNIHAIKMIFVYLIKVSTDFHSHVQFSLQKEKKKFNDKFLMNYIESMEEGLLQYQ